jgi:HSP20 family molecular chaperone IbpA
MLTKSTVVWMWPEACATLARAEALHRQFFHVAPRADTEPAWEPPVDVFETRDHVRLYVALPGVDPRTISAAIDGNALVVAGERTFPDLLEDALVHRLELPHGRFARRVVLPRGSYDDAQCATADGCLIVTLNKIV